MAEVMPATQPEWAALKVTGVCLLCSRVLLHHLTAEGLPASGASKQASVAPDSSSPERPVSHTSEPPVLEESSGKSEPHEGAMDAVAEAAPNHSRAVVPPLSLSQHSKRPTGDAHTHIVSSQLVESASGCTLQNQLNCS